MLRHYFLGLGAIASAVAMSLVNAAPSTLTLSNSTKGTSNVPVTMPFSLARSGDLGFDAVLNYHTADGTAVAGTDYTAASGSFVMAAGIAASTIPVTLLPNTGNGANAQFQLIADGAVGVGPTPTFAAQQTFDTGNVPNSVTVADINGDGKPDVITANQESGTISILMNTTSPGASTSSFAAQQTFNTDRSPESITAADLNGDGKPDLIVTNSVSKTLTLFINTTVPGSTTPSFGLPQHPFTGNGPFSVTTADVNGDGKPDLIVANYGDNTVEVLINTTSPGATAASFAAAQTFSTGAGPISVTTADLNGDGLPDLIVANKTDNTVSVLTNSTTPGSTTPTFRTGQFAVGASPVSVSTADVNGDGKPDLIVANNGDNTVSILINTSSRLDFTAQFASQQTFAAGPAAAAISAADLNGDGKPDLIVTNAGDNTVSVFRNITVPGAATSDFDAPQKFATGRHPAGVIAADINLDGKPDVIVANSSSSPGTSQTVSVLLNTTTLSAAVPGFGTASNTSVGSNPVAVTAVDLDGDGRQDLAVANAGSNDVSVLLNRTPPGTTQPIFSTAVLGAGSHPSAVTHIDVNDDGLQDLIVSNSASNNVSVLINNGGSGFLSQVTFAVGTSPSAVAGADIDGDGKPDLIVTNSGSNTVSVLLNETTPGTGMQSMPRFANQITFAVGGNPQAVCVADLNGDGTPDVIVANADDNTLSELFNTTAPGASTPTFLTQQTLATGTSPSSVTAADVNADGKPDLIVANYGDNTVEVLINTTSPGATIATFAAPQTFATGAGPISVTAADVNGDGFPDLFVANKTDNTVSLLINTTSPGSTTASFAAQQTFAAGTSPMAVAALDVNGDDAPDLIVVNNGSNSVSTLLNTRLQVKISGSPATGTIVHDYIFADGFGN